MRYLTLNEVLDIHVRLVEQSGGASGVRDLAGIESAIAQPQQSFGGVELNPTIEEKATVLCLSLVMNHPFVDGNKRVGHAAMELFLVLNGYELTAHVDNGEATILALAAGELTREQLLEWVQKHIKPL